MEIENMESPLKPRYEKLAWKDRIKCCFAHTKTCLKVLFTDMPKYAVIGDPNPEHNEPLKKSIVLGLASERQKRSAENA